MNHNRIVLVEKYLIRNNCIGANAVVKFEIIPALKELFCQTPIQFAQIGTHIQQYFEAEAGVGKYTSLIVLDRRNIDIKKIKESLPARTKVIEKAAKGASLLKYTLVVVNSEITAKITAAIVKLKAENKKSHFVYIFGDTELQVGVEKFVASLQLDKNPICKHFNLNK